MIIEKIVKNWNFWKMIFWIFGSIFQLKNWKKWKKSKKFFPRPPGSLTRSPAVLLIPGCDSEGFFLPFLSAYHIIFLPAGVRSASGRRRVGVGSASGRRGVGAESEFSGRGFVVRNRFWMYKSLSFDSVSRDRAYENRCRMLISWNR